MAGSSIVLVTGVKAYEIALHDRDGWGDLQPTSAMRVQARFNALLASIEEQGGKVLGMFTTTVALAPRPGVAGTPTTEVHFVIVRK